MHFPSLSQRTARRAPPAGRRPCGPRGQAGRVLVWLLLPVVLVLGAAASVWMWLDRPMVLAEPTVELSVEPGTAPRAVAKGWVDAGLQTDPEWLYQWFRWSGDAKRIRAGSYSVTAGITPRALLDKMVQGSEILEQVRLPEGQTFREWRTALAAAPHLRQTLAGLDDAAVMKALGIQGPSTEGRFFPDTYSYSRGVSDAAVLKRAHSLLQAELDKAWAKRDPDLPLKTPEELLILASIVEKETGRDADRAKVAAVFANRTRIGMPLQTDPTVIYGIGPSFDGNLRKRDLETDTPFNTYTRRGLPPTPISMPSKASLQAAAKPEDIKALYFVARGDGTSAFSDNLRDHNKAVNQFQRGIKATP